MGIALAGCRARYCSGSDRVELCARTEYANREEEAHAGAQLMAAIFEREGGAQALSQWERDPVACAIDRYCSQA